MFNAKLIKNEILRKIEHPGARDYVEVSLKDGSNNRTCVILKKYMDLFADRVKKMEIYDDDVWVITFPKCGTTWTQEMVWMLNNNLDYETALSTELNDRFPFLELNGSLNKFDGDSVGICESLSRPRHIKSHLPIFMLPDKLWIVKPKIIYVARNPKDTAVSFFHFSRNIVGYKGSKECFIDAFLNDLVIYAPFNKHVLDFWNIRHEANILFLHFEDMKTNLAEVIELTMKHLGKNYNQNQIDKLCNHLSFGSMRINPMVNNDRLVQKGQEVHEIENTGKPFNFIRNGQIGAFKTELSEEYNNLFDNFVAESSLHKYGFFYKGISK